MPKGVLTLPNEGERTAIGRARLIRDRCLVREGCSICIERCPEGALTLIFGRTIRVSKRRCTGCGGCRHACPAKPKAMSIEPLNGRP
ncbi:4Fe-4S dicluster domain-containing protein [Geobacter anodireducens]|uniref:4Fe-4S dicluster domain-containing protein n=1 Tax=Geobacter soli TaxID=1510391 RepID=UPI001F2345A7|nr:4Fe-4S dicluster domain-containing protein [Geobacter soli]